MNKVYHKKRIIIFTAACLSLFHNALLQAITSRDTAIAMSAAQYQQAKTAKLIPFTPDKTLGGVHAQGKYNHNNHKAIIKHKKTTYTCTHIIEDRNPTLPKKKRIEKNLLPLGSFTKKFVKGMPITIYLYGHISTTKKS